MSEVSNLPTTGFVRLAAILGPHGRIPVSKSTWWAGVKVGRFPRPLKLGPRITVWRVEDIRALVSTGASVTPAPTAHQLKAHPECESLRDDRSLNRPAGPAPRKGET